MEHISISEQNSDQQVPALNTWPRLNDDAIERVISCLKSRQLSGSGLDIINEFEASVERWLGGGHVVSTNSGTSALMVALLALGIKPGDTVICPAYTWCATPHAALLIGAKPKFVAIDPATYNICPNALRQAMSSDVKAIMVVHMHGMCCDMDAISEVVREFSVPVVGDCAQAHGARYKGREVGLLSDVDCFSMQKSKHLSAGDGGYCVTKDPKLAQKIRDICNFGVETPKTNYRFDDVLRDGYEVFRECDQIGGMFRLNPLCAALAIDQLQELDSHIAGVQSVMNDLLTMADDLPFFKISRPISGSTHVWHKIRVGISEDAVAFTGLPMAEIRRQLRAALAESGIPTTLWTAPILPLQTGLAEWSGQTDWTVTPTHFAIESSFMVFDENFPLIAQDKDIARQQVAMLVSVWKQYFSETA
ncbi:DegT/DnrJ/EryC1/StrS family aminotransferase [Palleronia caenipelagi]|uniref:DegT/DnrJ/EryC1/StrS aminotransferase family protein n=1 Tax=Palleronia caenipelagi TaxID=2489174 RepID=UPI001C8FA2DF|nr:DegT/DnrJ/EryC1/StrS family aminotransferase [Palleronia caenipelagi]